MENQPNCWINIFWPNFERDMWSVKIQCCRSTSPNLETEFVKWISDLMIFGFVPFQRQVSYCLFLWIKKVTWKGGWMKAWRLVHFQERKIKMKNSSVLHCTTFIIFGISGLSWVILHLVVNIKWKILENSVVCKISA